MAKKGKTPEKKKKNENKNKNTKKSQKKIIPIDCIPKHSQQPRSSPPKRRTDFSVFVCTSSSPSNPGSSPGSSSGEVRLCDFATSSLRERRMAVKQFPEDILVRCSNYQEGRPVCSSEFSDGYRDTSNDPHGSPVSDNNWLAVTPGSVVWARTASQMWWPAEIMEERSTLSDPVNEGHVLVQFYGNHPSARIDPTTDLSTFEDSFEERSNNPSKDFQKALKQALQRKEQLSSCRKLSPDGSAPSDQQDRSSDKGTSPTSSRTINDFLERGRGKRERKRKVHFDEVTFPLKSERKVRRLKIMRYLGLAAPVGSPF